jgi:glutathione S-transferase
MSMTLYDLAGAEEDRRISPFCWRVRLALVHKGLAVDTVPWRMVEKDAIAASGQGKVPVLADGDRVIADSWTIFEYLDDAYPDRPALFEGGKASRPVYAFIRNWSDGELMPVVARMILGDFFRHLHEKDRSFFRETREKIFGMRIEDLGTDRDSKVGDFRAKLGPLRRQLDTAPFVAGAAPGLGDYLIFSIFMWSRSVSPFALVAPDDVVSSWIDRMLDAHGGQAGAAPGYSAAA